MIKEPIALQIPPPARYVAITPPTQADAVTTEFAHILEDVVQQFSDPFAFFRELVQNSIDAGTQEIEIDVTYEVEGGADDGDGIAVATVRDFGCGMTREIIETQLCRLFSSAKYGDYTKIGRFGIGFVSVYGVEPEWVCVDTGRDGESWRIIFLPDRSYELRALREPVEGTTVRVAKRLSRDEFSAFRERARDVIASWCAHVPVPVTFAGHDLRQPFELDSPCVVEFEEQGTRAVIGLVERRAAPCAYYSHGLLLQEQAASPWPHVSFKVDSRHLEHTLTRDDLLHDHGYHRAVELLEQLATTQLPQMLLRELEELASGAPCPRRDRLLSLLAEVVPSGVLSVWHRHALIPSTEGPISAERVASVARLYSAPEPTPLTDAVAQRGEVVVFGPHDALASLLYWHRYPLRDVNDVFVLLDVDPTRRKPSTSAFVRALLVELRHYAAEPSDVAFARWNGPPIAVARDSAEAQLRAALRPPKLAELHGARLVLNLDTELVAAALRLARVDAAFAAALVCAALTPKHAADAAVRAARGSAR